MPCSPNSWPLWAWPTKPTGWPAATRWRSTSASGLQFKPQKNSPRRGMIRVRFGALEAGALVQGERFRHYRHGVAYQLPVAGLLGLGDHRGEQLAPQAEATKPRPHEEALELAPRAIEAS